MEGSPLPKGQLAQRNPTDADSLQSSDFQADKLAHPANLALLALAQYKAQLMFILPRDLGRPKGLPIQGEAMIQKL
jgi:hypothetical protein